MLYRNKKRFTNVSNSLDRKEYSKRFEGQKLIAKVTLSWKKSFSMGAVIPHKMRNCTEGKEDSFCDGCDELVNQNKEFSANLNELKRQPPNKYGHMLPK